MLQFLLLNTLLSINLNVIEPWFKVDEKEPVAYAKIEIVEAAEMKPSDLNGYYPFLYDDIFVILFFSFFFLF